MAHICHLMVDDFQRGSGRHDERGVELYDNYNLESAVVYCEDLIEAGHTICPSQGWNLAAMRDWARSKVHVIRNIPFSTPSERRD